MNEHKLGDGHKPLNCWRNSVSHRLRPEHVRGLVSADMRAAEAVDSVAAQGTMA